MIHMASVSSVVTLLAALALVGCNQSNRSRDARESRLNWHGQTTVSLPLSIGESGRPYTLLRIRGGEVKTLIDSGAGIAALEPDLAAALGVAANGSGRANGRPYDSADGVSIQLGPASIDLHKVLVADLSNESRAVLGMDLFRQAVIELDFAGGRMTLTHPSAFIPPEGESVAVRLVRGVPVLQMNVNGSARQLCTIIDTGFSGGVAVSRELASELGLPGFPDRLAVSEGFGGVRYVGAALAPLERVSIGSNVYRELPVIETRRRDEHDCDSLLGMAALARHRLVFDIGGSRVWFLPPTGSP